MAANGANDAAIRGFLHQLLHSIVRQIENNDGRGDHGDGVLYRVDWLYNCLVRYVGSYNIDENIVRLVGRSRVMLEDIVNAHSNSDNNGSDKPTQLLSTCFSQVRVRLERVMSFKDLLPNSEPNNYKANQLGTKLRLHCRHDRHCFRFGELSSVATGEETHELLHRWPRKPPSFERTSRCGQAFFNWPRYTRSKAHKQNRIYKPERETELNLSESPLCKRI